jgi:hypothetical protein
MIQKFLVVGICLILSGILNCGCISNDDAPLSADEKQLSNIIIDSDHDDLNNEEEKLNNTDSNKSDTDGDGLSDGFEVKISRTDPNSKSTDGDRYSDYDEVYGTNLPSYVKEKYRSPFYPAFPDIQIIPSNSFEICLEKKITSASEVINEGTYTYSSGYTQTTDTINGGYIKGGLSGDVFKAIVLNRLPFYIDGGLYHTNKHTTTLYSNQTNTITTGKKWYYSEETNLANSYVSIPIKIKNIGSDILQSEIDDVVLNVYIGNDTSPSLQTWNLARQNYKIKNLKPEDTSVTITTQFYGLTVEKLKRIDMGEGIRIVVDHFSFGEDEIHLQNSINRMIKVTIDDDTSVVYEYIRPQDANTFMNIISNLTNITLENGQIKCINNIPNTAHSTWVIIASPRTEIDNIEELNEKKFIAGDEISLIYLQDSDGDNITDRDERLLGINPNCSDTDGDTLNDYDELTIYKTKPGFVDSDFDGLQDNEELKIGIDGQITDPNSPDMDYDGLSDYEEYLNHTNPKISDTDGDKIKDGDEVKIHHTNPNEVDTDGDSINDYDEINAYRTDPTKKDTDDDGHSDKDDVIPTRDAKIRISILKFEIIDQVDAWPDDSNKAQIYFKLYIDGVECRIPISGELDATMGEMTAVSNGFIEYNTNDDKTSQEITIEMYDVDWSSSNDVLDIDGKHSGTEVSDHSLTINYNVVTGKLTGDDNDGRTNGSNDGSQDSDEDDAYLEYWIETI